ncbi:hypothetical protein [Ruminococcus sp.]|uniref:hypothetical protein n=1 Tax=Ruminococcus sp. TaxID=41978 RepID=UPI0025F208D8|nr:hypothetical protein [Ruminococcus sp.]MBQ8967286.1 hypothetical protein [Ruminococcus sp.]
MEEKKEQPNAVKDIKLKSAENKLGKMPATFTMRKEREDMIKKGIVFPRTSELTYIDDNGNLIEI